MSFINDNILLIVPIFLLIFLFLIIWLNWYFTSEIEPWLGGEKRRWKLSREQIEGRRRSAYRIRVSIEEEWHEMEGPLDIKHSKSEEESFDE
jgi:hypothetical protein